MLTYLAAWAVHSIRHLDQSLEAPITYETRAARVPMVLTELSKLTHTSLKSSPQMENEVLIVSVKDSPLSDVLQRVATATSGEWKQEGDVMRLMPDKKERAREDQEDLNQRIADFKGLVANRTSAENRLEQELTKRGKESTSSAGPLSDLAGSKLITSLLQGVDARSVAQTPGRLVFSTEPTQRQLPFGDNAATAINDFIAAHNASAPSVPPILAEDRAGLDMYTLRPGRSPRQASVGKIGPVAKVLVTSLSRTFPSNGENCSFAATFYDSSGKVVARISPSIANGVGLESDTNGHAPKDPVAITYPSDSIEFAKILSLGPDDDIETSDSLRKKLLSPAMSDPLSFHQTDELLAYAKAKHEPIVADIPDDWGQRGLRDPLPKDTAGVEQQIQFGKSVEQLKDPAFIMIRPILPARSRSTRLNRAALAQVIEAGAETGVPTLKDVCAFVSHTPQQIFDTFGDRFIKIAAPTVAGGANSSNWLALLFYSKLSPTQRESIEKEGRLKAGALTTEQRAALERIVFEDGEGCELRTPITSASDFARISDVRYKPGDYRSEQTEVAPNGVPDTATIDFDIQTEPFSVRLAKDGLSRFGAMALAFPQTYAESLDAAENPVPNNPARLLASAHMRVGEQAEVGFSIHIGPETDMGRVVYGFRIARDAKTVAMDGLPKEFKDAIANLLNSLRAGHNQTDEDGHPVIHP